MQLGFKLEISFFPKFWFCWVKICAFWWVYLFINMIWRHFRFKFYHFRQLFVHFLMPDVEPMTSRWPVCPLMAANLQRQFDYPPLFLPMQPQVMRYVWKKVRQAKVSGGGGWLRACRGAKGPFKLQRPQIGQKTHASRRGEEEGPHKSNFPKKGEMHQMRRWR